MNRSAGMVLVFAVVGLMVLAGPASAHRWPANCLSNGIDLTIDKNVQVVRNGDVIVYDLWIENTKNGPCDITESGTDLFFPTATGASSATPHAIARNQTYIGGFPFTQIGTQSHTVAVNPGVENAIARGTVAGTLHDVPGDTSFAGVNKTLGTQVTQPSIAIDKTGSIAAGQAPQNVIYTYAVTNTSTTPVPMNRVGVDDNICATPTYSRGDNGDGLLSNNETWIFTCSMLHQAPGSYTNTAHACAYSTVPGDTARQVCSPPDTWTVTLTSPPPPPPPQNAVLPSNVTQAPCLLATQRSLTVRAGQLNTIRVTVRTDVPVANKLVRITLPGGKVVSARTNSKGIATLKVRPTKSGRATIRAEDCTNARVSVRAARRVAARQVPRVTG